MAQNQKMWLNVSKNRPKFYKFIKNVWLLDDDRWPGLALASSNRLLSHTDTDADAVPLGE